MLAVLSMHVKAKKTDTKNDLSVSMATYNSNSLVNLKIHSSIHIILFVKALQML